MRKIQKNLCEMVREIKAGRPSRNTLVAVSGSLLKVYFHDRCIFVRHLVSGEFKYDFCGYEASPSVTSRINACLEAVGFEKRLFRKGANVACLHEGRPVLLDGTMTGGQVTDACAAYAAERQG